MEILSSFTPPSSSSKPAWKSLFCWTQKEDILKNVETEQFWGIVDFHSIFFLPTMVVNGAPKQPGYNLSSEYLPLCSAEQRYSCRFGTTWGGVNDQMFIFEWTIPLRHLKNNNYTTVHECNCKHLVAMFYKNQDWTYLVKIPCYKRWSAMQAI